MTATQTTARAFGKCSRRGCRHTHVLDLITKTAGRDLRPGWGVFAARLS